MLRRCYVSSAVVLSAVLFMFGSTVFAAHPLITDDAGTQGKGKYQVEVVGGYEQDKVESVKTGVTEVGAALTVGVTDSVDVVIGIPYQSVTVKDGSTKVTEEGFADTELAVKWRFYEHNGLSLALKPGLTLPTGDEEKGFGPGRTTYGMTLITTKEIKPYAFHFNLGYVRNNYKIDAVREVSRKGIWHASAAGEFELSKHLKFVADIGIDTNEDKESNVYPAYLLGGLILEVAKGFDIDCGLKFGLNKPAPDTALLLGLTFKF